MEESVRPDTFVVGWPRVAVSRQVQLSGIVCGVVRLSVESGNVCPVTPVIS